jgi:capsular polysaccharide export protein
MLGRHRCRKPPVHEVISPLGVPGRLPHAASSALLHSVVLRRSQRERVALAAAFPEAETEATEAIAVWSASRYRRAALREAATRGLPALLLRPRLLRGPPGWGNPPPVLSVTASIIGPASALDNVSPDRVLMSHACEDPMLLDRAAAARRALAGSRVGGAWGNAGSLPESDGLVFIAADEPDAPHSAELVEDMLATATLEHDAPKIVLLNSSGACPRAVLTATAALGCAIVDRPVDPWAVIERADRIYSAGGEIGWLALLAGRRVHCFGDAFYTGWGVTDDAPSVAQKPFRRSVDQIFAAACLLATRCIDPFSQRLATFEHIVALLAEWRRIETANRKIAVCLGMSWWKRRWIGDFLRSAAGPPRRRRIVRSALAAAAARPGSAIAVWASRLPSGLAALAARQGTPLITVEDGFLRSVGLGSDFVPAASLALDASGSHCDPWVCSDLERLLRDTEFADGLLGRAHNLIARLVDQGITKYDVTIPSGSSCRGTAALTAGRRHILVPGQVEDDLSVRLGGEGISSNLDFLARVRATNPDAIVLYKPHPDVAAGHRRGAVPWKLAARFADAVINRPIATILAEIDEVHVLTSLTGFEALLRGLKVVVYGRPFYAGWGLTEDVTAIDRGRRLSLEELVAGALILYPRYLDPVTRLPCAPELLVERMADPQLWRVGPLVIARRWQGFLARRWARIASGSTVRLSPPPGTVAAERPVLF